MLDVINRAAKISQEFERLLAIPAIVAIPAPKNSQIATVASSHEIEGDEIAATWKLYCRDGRRLWVVSSPPISKLEVIRSYEGEGLLRAEVGQSCGQCKHMRWLGIANFYCSNPERLDLEPAYSKGHPLKILPADDGAACERFESRLDVDCAPPKKSK